MLKTIMLLLLLSLTDCGVMGGGENFNYRNFNQTESTCNQASTTLKTLYHNAFKTDAITEFIIEQFKNGCIIKAKVNFTTEGNTLRVSNLEISNCEAENLDFEDTYTYSIENNILTLSSNTCVTKYRKY